MRRDTTKVESSPRLTTRNRSAYATSMHSAHITEQARCRIARRAAGEAGDQPIEVALCMTGFASAGVEAPQTGSDRPD